MGKQRLAFLVAAGVGILGSVMPWASIGPISVSGMQLGGGAIILLMAIAGVLAYLGDRNTDLGGWKFWTAFGTLALSGLIGLVKVLEVMGASSVGLGIGLILVAIAGIGGAVSAFVLKSKA